MVLASFSSSRLFILTGIEILYNSALCYPHVNHNFRFDQQGFPLYYKYDEFYFSKIGFCSLNQIFTLFQFGRVYLFWRFWTQYSIWNDKKATTIWFT